jgi:hypothetical protein
MKYKIPANVNDYNRQWAGVRSVLKPGSLLCGTYNANETACKRKKSLHYINAFSCMAKMAGDWRGSGAKTGRKDGFKGKNDLLRDK